VVDTVIKPGHWTIILEGIHKGRCVPFLGAGVNVDCPRLNYKGLPLGGEVALGLIEKLTGLQVADESDLASVENINQGLKDAGLDQDLARLYFTNLPRVALHVQVTNMGRRAELIEWLQEILQEDQRRPSKLLDTLAKMPLQLIVTTNYDRLLEQALDRAIDIQDVPGLAVKLRDAADPVSQYLRSTFSTETRQLLDGYDGTAPPPQALSTALAEELDGLLDDANFYNDQRFPLATLPSDIQKLIAGGAAGRDRIRLNRLLLENAYPSEIAKSRKPYDLVVQPIEGFQGLERTKQSTILPDEDTLTVYKIHGTFQAQDSSRLIITEQDYVQFLTTVGRDAQGIPPRIRQRLIDGNLLFVGYSLEDWDFRTLYQVLIEGLPDDDRRTSFAIQWNPPDFWVEYWKGQGIQIYHYDVHKFAEELQQRYVARYGSLGARGW
jgi:hypothetical protein